MRKRGRMTLSLDPPACRPPRFAIFGRGLVCAGILTSAAPSTRGHHVAPAASIPCAHHFAPRLLSCLHDPSRIRKPGFFGEVYIDTFFVSGFPAGSGFFSLVKIVNSTGDPLTLNAETCRADISILESTQP